jgi:hypothetical protein
MRRVSRESFPTARRVPLPLKRNQGIFYCFRSVRSMLSSRIGERLCGWETYRTRGWIWFRKIVSSLVRCFISLAFKIAFKSLTSHLDLSSPSAYSFCWVQRE